MWDMGDGMTWWMAISAAAVIILALWVADAIRPGAETPKSAADIARERYARGEISRQQFEQISEDLRKAV